MTLPEWNFGPYRLEPADARLTREEKTLPLRPKAFAVLCHLVERSGRLVGKDELLNAVWPRGYVSDSVVEVCINQLRKALEDDPRSPRYIETVPKRGYRFIAEVAVQCAESDEAPTAVTTHAHTAPPDAERWAGRKGALARLHGLWAETLAGERRILFLTGEAGIGKTTLIEMLLRDLGTEPNPPPVLWGQCIDHFGAGEAFLPLLSALGGYVPYCKAVFRSVAPTWLAQLPGAVAPEERADLQQEVIGANRERMLREGCELLEALSTRTPLVLVLEDLHWSDNATLELLSLLGRRRGRAPLLVIGSYRPGDAALRDHPVKQVQQELESHRLCAELALDTWRFEEVQDYLAKRFPEQAPPEPVARLLHRRSGGHPLFLVNLLDYLLSRGQLQPLPSGWNIGGADTLETQIPDDVRQMIRHQVSRLSPEEQRLLGVASAAGVESSAALLASALDRDVVDVEAVCESLARRGVILANTGITEWPDGTVAGQYAFRHALYADVLYQDLTPACRVSLHLRLAERLESAHGAHTSDIAAELARHFEAGRNSAQAVHYLALAAEQSARRYANREALDYLNRALRWADRLPEAARIDARLKLLQLRSRVNWALTEWAAVLSDLEALVELARDAGRIETEIGALHLLTLATSFCDRRHFQDLLKSSHHRSLEIADSRFQAYASGYLAYFHLDFGGWRDTERADFECALEGVRALNDANLLAHFGAMQSTLLCSQSCYMDALCTADEVVQLSLRQRDSFNYMGGQYYRTWPLLYSGNWRQLVSAIDEGLHTASQNSNLFIDTAYQLVKAALHLQAFDFQGAEVFCMNVANYLGDQYTKYVYQLMYGHTYLGLGRLTEAWRFFHEIEQALDGGALIELRYRLMFYENLGAYWLAEGDSGKARSAAGRLLELATPPGNRHFLAIGHRLLALCAQAENDRPEAAARIEQALTFAEDGEVPLAAWQVHAAAAELHERWGDSATAEEHHRQAATVLRGLADGLGDTDEGRILAGTLLSALRPLAPQALPSPS